MTFRERFMLDQTDFEEIFDLTDEWNASDDIRTLREYLGLTEEEEDVWISDSDEALEELLLREKNRRIFFTDLDDTLLNSEKEITARNREALDRILAQGHPVVINTGRAVASAKVQAKRLKLSGKGCYAACYNGGQLVDLSNGKTLFRNGLTADIMDRCFAIAEREGVHIQAYSDDAVIIRREDEEIRYYCSYQLLPYEVVSDPVSKTLTEGTPKLLAIILDDQEALQAFGRTLTKELGEHLDAFLSSDKFLEIVPKGVNKGDTIHFLCDHLHIPVAHAIAAGDQANDIPMIREAGIGCAVANAIPELKAEADYITEADCNHDGVAEILNKFIP